MMGNKDMGSNRNRKSNYNGLNIISMIVKGLSIREVWWSI